MTNRQSISIVAILIFVINGCTPTRVSDEVSLTPPSHWQHQPETASSNTDLKQWWQGFHDPLLDELITQALAANHDLKVAQERIKEVKALATVAKSALYPGIDLFASGGREKKIDRIVGVPGSSGIELVAPTGDSISGGLSARWEIDLFGGRQLDEEAVLAQVLGAEETLRFIRVSLLAQVATNYFELRGLQKKIAIQQKIIDVNREKLRTLQAFKQAGLANDSDVSGQEALLSSSEAVLPALTQSESALIHRLGVLLGELPAKLETKLASINAKPTDIPVLPALLPAELLSQRPDVRMAKTQVTTAAAKSGSARADLFPKIQLSASAGFGAIAVAGFPSLAESVYTLGTGLTAPIFNAGRIQAYISAADSRLKQAAANYEKTFLLAVEDIENAYVAYTTAINQNNEFSKAEAAANNAYEQKNMHYKLTTAENLLSVLDAQKNGLALTYEKTNSDTAIYISLVSLYRAFGSGWSL